METPAFYFTKALSHRQKVLRLYRRALKECHNWYSPDILEMRYQQVLVRSRFDAHKNETDTRKSKKLLLDGIRELFEKRHIQPYISPYDEGGNAWHRDLIGSDLVFDTWSYHEREQFPKFFARREQRKKEILDQWDKIEASWKKY